MGLLACGEVDEALEDQARGDQFDVGVAEEFEALVGDVACAGGARVGDGGFVGEGCGGEVRGGYGGEGWQVGGDGEVGVGWDVGGLRSWRWELG